jgi:hypothetical protein
MRWARLLGSSRVVSQSVLPIVVADAGEPRSFAAVFTRAGKEAACILCMIWPMCFDDNLADPEPRPVGPTEERPEAPSSPVRGMSGGILPTEFLQFAFVSKSQTALFKGGTHCDQKHLVVERFRKQFDGRRFHGLHRFCYSATSA